MSKKNRGGFTPRTEPTIPPSEPRVFAEVPAVEATGVEGVVQPLPVPLDAPDPEVVDQVLEGVDSTDPIDPPVFEEPEQVTSVEVPHAHPRVEVEEVSPKADTLPPDATDTDEEHPLPEGLKRLSIEEVLRGYEEYVAVNPGHHIIDVLHPRLKELVPHLVKEVDVSEVLAFRGAAQALLKREKAKGPPCTSEGIIQFESTSFALWLVDPSVPVPSDAKIYVHKWYDVVTFLWGNRIILSATEQELQAYRG